MFTIYLGTSCQQVAQLLLKILRYVRIVAVRRHPTVA